MSARAFFAAFFAAVLLPLPLLAQATNPITAEPVSGSGGPPIVLHAAHLLNVEQGALVTPGEVLVEGNRITAAGTSAPTCSAGPSANSSPASMPTSSPSKATRSPTFPPSPASASS